MKMRVVIDIQTETKIDDVKVLRFLNQTFLMPPDFLFLQAGMRDSFHQLINTVVGTIDLKDGFKIFS